jgi:hypothetical protein
MASNIPEMIVVIRHILVIGSRTGLRTMLSAGVLAVLLACAGTAAGEAAAGEEAAA